MDTDINHFGGLVYNNYNHSLLEGQPNISNWFFAIGMYCSSRSNWLNNAIPANGVGTNRVRLFAKINSIEIPAGYLIERHVCTIRFHYSISYFQTFVLSIQVFISI